MRLLSGADMNNVQNFEIQLPYSIMILTILTTFCCPRECNTETPQLVSYRGENCSSSGVACVSGGSGPWEGLAHLGGRPICQDGWGSSDARVFRRQMGFRDMASFGGDRFGTARGPFLMNQLQCQGSEGSISECDHESPVSNLRRPESEVGAILVP